MVPPSRHHRRVRAPVPGRSLSAVLRPHPLPGLPAAQGHPPGMASGRACDGQDDPGVPAAEEAPAPPSGRLTGPHGISGRRGRPTSLPVPDRFNTWRLGSSGLIGSCRSGQGSELRRLAVIPPRRRDPQRQTFGSAAQEKSIHTCPVRVCFILSLRSLLKGLPQFTNSMDLSVLH